MSAIPRLRRWWLPGLLALGIGLFSLIPVSEQGSSGLPLGVRLDLVAHFLGYGALGMVVGHASENWRVDTRVRLLVFLAAIVGYGAVIEGIQAAVPTRQPSLLDASANALGALAGLLVADWQLVRSPRD